jgi:Xaa-Pro aminopeptidase
MHRVQRQRTHNLLKRNGIARALFAHPESVTWLTGFVPLVEVGQSPFGFGPAPSLLWYEDGHFTLFFSDLQVDTLPDYTGDPDITVRKIEAYAVHNALRGVDAVIEALQEILTAASSTGTMGIEGNHLSMRQFQAIAQPLHPTGLRLIDGWLKPLRMIKTDEEITKLRRAFELADIGFAAAHNAAQVGAREIDVWAAAESAIQRMDGRRVPLGNDCTVSYRPFNIGAYPGEYVIRPNDTLIMDISAQHKGYWSDGCRTLYPSEMTTDQLKRHRFINDALDYAISLVKPGAKANEIDAQVRSFIERGDYPVYPHHTGHGVGVSFHEEPRIVPYNDTTLEAGMVIMLEPGTYIPGESACRLEDGMLVTHDGAEILTSAPRLMG